MLVSGILSVLYTPLANNKSPIITFTFLFYMKNQFIIHYSQKDKLFLLFHVHFGTFLALFTDTIKEGYKFYNI